MKNKGLIIGLISVFSLLIVSLIVLMFVFINKEFSFNFSFSTTIDELQIDKKYEEVFDVININTTASVIDIKKSDDKLVKLKVYSKVNESRVDVKNNVLSINVMNEKCKFLCFNRKISKIELYVPEDYENVINVDNKFGDINIGKLDNLSINVKEDAGDISIDSVNKAVIDNKYGDIKIGNVKLGNIKASAGDIEISNSDNLEIENNYGDVELGSVNEYVSIKANCGDIEIDNLNIVKDSIISNDYGDIDIRRTNAFIDAHTDLGKVEVNNNKSDVTVNISNNCGDIKVN